MRLRLVAAAGVLLLSPLCAALANSVNSIDQLIVFGDSLSDNGNAAAAHGGTLPGNYAKNAFTDGPNTMPATTGPFGLWIDQLAPKLNVPDPQPFVAATQNGQILTGGDNYAVASALTGHNPQFTGQLPPKQVPWTSDQVAIYLALSVGQGGVDSKALYTFWAGSNDIFQGVNPITAADNVAANIATLAGAGAKNFLWLNEPLLGDTPIGRASGQQAILNAASAAYDAEFAVDVDKLKAAGVNVIPVDIESLFVQMINNPGHFGFTDVTDPGWCGQLGLNNCATNNPNDFLFWDTEHPTTAADAWIAQLAYNDLTGTSTPEPAAASLAGAGILTLFGVFVVRRRGVLR